MNAEALLNYGFMSDFNNWQIKMLSNDLGLTKSCNHLVKGVPQMFLGWLAMPCV